MSKITHIQCSVGILTFNSGKTLRRALESVKNCDDIVISDGGSTDDTLDIAREYGARVIAQDEVCKDSHGFLKDFSCAKNQLIAEAKHPYLLILDSDEAASPDLVVALTHIAQSGTEDGYRIPIRMWWRGRMIEYAANYPGYQYRIVRTDRGVRMVKPVHERPVFSQTPGATSMLTAPWYVYLDDDFVYRYMGRNKKYVRRELESLGAISLRHFILSVFPRNMRSIAGITLKVLWYHVRHPRAVLMPCAVEWGRVRYHFALIMGALKQVCRV